jgi:hypothetical protein
MPANRRASVLILILATEIQPHAHARRLGDVHEEKGLAVLYVKAIHRRRRSVVVAGYSRFQTTVLILNLDCGAVAAGSATPIA